MKFCKYFESKKKKKLKPCLNVPWDTEKAASQRDLMFQFFALNIIPNAHYFVNILPSANFLVDTIVQRFAKPQNIEQ